MVQLSRRPWRFFYLQRPAIRRWLFSLKPPTLTIVSDTEPSDVQKRRADARWPRLTARHCPRRHTVNGLGNCDGLGTRGTSALRTHRRSPAVSHRTLSGSRPGFEEVWPANRWPLTRPEEASPQPESCQSRRAACGCRLCRKLPARFERSATSSTKTLHRECERWCLAEGHEKPRRNNM